MASAWSLSQARRLPENCRLQAGMPPIQAENTPAHERVLSFLAGLSVSDIKAGVMDLSISSIGKEGSCFFLLSCWRLPGASGDRFAAFR
jgi:hypothetical protein